MSFDWLASQLPEGAIEEGRKLNAEREARRKAALWYCRIPYCGDGGGMLSFWVNADGTYESDDTRFTDKDIREAIRRFGEEWGV